jgi:hypothetical protein
MYPHSEKHDNNKQHRTKATAAAIPMIGAIVTAALLVSGLSLISSYQPAIAQQQNMTEGGGTTGGNATTAAGGNQTAMTSEVILHLEEVRTALEDDDTDTALMHLDLALNALGANTTTTTGGVTNATAADGGEEGEEEEGEEEEGGTD